MQKTLTNDKDILLRLLQQAYNDDSLTQPAKREYEKLVARFDEEGTDLEISDSDIDVGRAAAFHELSEVGYVDHLLRFQRRDERKSPSHVAAKRCRASPANPSGTAKTGIPSDELSTARSFPASCRVP